MIIRVGRGLCLLVVLMISLLPCGRLALAERYMYNFPGPDKEPESGETVVGYFQSHTVEEKETLLDIARDYGLGFNEIQLLYPHLDPWIPEVGSTLVIPTKWVLPLEGRTGIVINIPEMRLYLFFPKTKIVKTYPVGIGDLAWETPEGSYRIVSRKAQPTWVIPKSLREKYGVNEIPPGPDNPLGNYWLGLSRKGYGIHGTNFPWGVGRLVSHGCIRLYPEHIEQLFDEVRVGTPVKIIYEPIKIGVRGRVIFMEVHPDIYRRIRNMEEHALKLLEDRGLLEHVILESLTKALKLRDGTPHSIGWLKGGDTPLAWNGAKRLVARTFSLLN